MKPAKKTPYRLAIEHWAWLEVLLQQQIIMEKKLFISGFIQGYEHGKEDKK